MSTKKKYKTKTRTKQSYHLHVKQNQRIKNNTTAKMIVRNIQFSHLCCR